MLAVGADGGCSFLFFFVVVVVFFLSPIIFLFLLPLWGGWIDDVILRPFQ